MRLNSLMIDFDRYIGILKFSRKYIIIIFISFYSYIDEFYIDIGYRRSISGLLN